MLYENGRLTQCVVGEVAYDVMFYGKQKTYRIYRKCKQPKWHEPLPTDAADSELGWEAWPVFASTHIAPNPPELRAHGDSPPSSSAVPAAPIEPETTLPQP